MSEQAMREAFGRALADYGAINPKVVVLDPDTSSSTLTNQFAARFPERFFNIGIAEPCMVDVAVGLALGGFIPFASGFAALVAFRAMEQVRTCVCYVWTNVKLIAGYAGVSDYKDGPTHHTITDIATMRALPEMTVIVPADATETAAWVPLLAAYDGPVYFRISRAVALPVHSTPPALAIGKGLTLRPGAGPDDHRRRHHGGAQPAGRRLPGGTGRVGACGGDAHHQAAGRRAGRAGRRRDRRAR